MARGGARNRSGPSPDPTSLRSQTRGLVLTALPREGYTGEAPAFPLEPITIFTEYFLERVKHNDYDAGATEGFRTREAAVWAEAWRTPQACAWATEPWRWPIVAEYCRLKTAVELDPTASASLVAQIHRYRDQIGLTPAGLKENGWALAKDVVGEKRDSKPDATGTPKGERTSARDRLKVVDEPAV